MLDVVIPLGKGSKYNNIELKFCLRAMEKHLSGFRNVWIVGQLPDFLKNVYHIPYEDKHLIPDRNIMEKLAAACQHEDITDSWLMFNDDIFLLQDYEASTFPYYYDNTIEKYFKRRGNDGYGKRANNTLKYLRSQKLPDKYFDVHTPIVYNKKIFLENIVPLPWYQEGFIIKSLYANMLKIKGEEMFDTKLNRPPRKDAKIFSTFPGVHSLVFKYLEEKFPTKSKYEI